MKVGDLIKVDYEFYPRLEGKSGVLVEKRAWSELLLQEGRAGWVVMIDGRVHPYTIAEENMELVNEDR